MDPYDLGDPALSRPIDATPPAPASPNAYDDVEPRPPGPPGPPSPPGALLTDPAPPVVVKDLNPSPDKEALKQQELQLQKQDEVKDAKQEPEPVSAISTRLHLICVVRHEKRHIRSTQRMLCSKLSPQIAGQRFSTKPCVAIQFELC